MTSDYKKYSLEKLQEWVHDAMNSDASPHEIYSAIREAVREDYYYHKDCISRASGLLELLSGHRPVKSGDSKKWDAWEENYYPEEVKDDGMRPWGHSDLEYHVANKKDKVKRWGLPVEMDPSGEYFVSFPDDLLEAADLKEGDQVEWVDQGDGSYLLKKIKQPSWIEGNELAKDKNYNEMIENGWSMTDDGFWIKE